MKYGCAASGPLVVTVQPLIDRWKSSATPRQTRGRDGVAVDAGDVGRGHEPGDLGGDRRGRVPALLLPALGAERGTVRDEEVRGRLDVVAVERRRR